MRLTEGPTQQGFSKTQPFYFILFFKGKFTEELIPCIAMELYVCVYINFFFILTYVLDEIAMAHLDLLFLQIWA